MELLIVTGLSGAGKSKAVEMLEDMDYVCVDNIPPKLIPAFGQILKGSNNKRTAIVVDARAGEGLDVLMSSLEELSDIGVNYRILFIDCDDTVLVNRFKETRRRHPLAKKYNNSTTEALKAERKLMTPLKDKADYVIDTTHMKPAQLKERVAGLFLSGTSEVITVQIMSFGFKHGIPADADLVFDVRCLPNPFYIPELKNLTGLDETVSSYVMSFEQSQVLFDKIVDLIDYAMPLYIEEGKSELVIAFGCTGGHHRSVTFAEGLAKHLEENGIKCSIHHRDIQK